MTKAIAGYKATFKASSSAGGTKARVSELQEVTWTDKHDTFDATSHDSNGARERIGGMTDFEAGVVGLYVDNSDSQVALFGALNSREKIDVQLVPAGSSAADQWSQSGFVSKWSIGGPVDGPARFSSSIVGTGGASAQGIFILARDTFTDSNRNLSAHTPDLGFGGWTYSGAADEWKIVSNKVLKTLDVGVFHFCRSDNDITDDNFEAFLDYTRSEGTDYSGERGGLYLLGHKTNNIALGEGVTVVFARQSPSQMRLLIVRRDSAGTIVQQVTVVSDLLIGLNDSLRIGAIVSGLEVQAYTEPAGGGTRTDYSAVTLTADLRDGDHQRIGLTGRAASVSGEPKIDNLTVIPA